MLYQAIDAHFAAMAPLRLAAESLQHFFSHPLIPGAFTPAARATAAGFELFERATRRYRKPSFGFDAVPIDGAPVAVREEIVIERPFCRLVHFARDVAPARTDPTVLVVAPMSGHYATLLRGTVAALLPEHEVYITDWTDARAVPLARGPFGLDDYVDEVIGFLRHLGRDTHVLAVCQPSPPVLAAVAALAASSDPAQPRSMTLMGGPVDTRVNPTVVNRLATSKPIDWFEQKAIHLVPHWYPGANRRVYPGFLQLSGFMSMNLDRHLGEHVKLFQHLVEGDGEGAAGHRRFYDEYLSVMDLSADFYLQTIRSVFQTHALPEGTMTHRGVKVEPRSITKTALMTIEGEKDDISGVGQTEAAHAICANIPAARRRHRLQRGVGHFGIFNGRRWREEIYPDLRDFIRSNR